MIKQQLLLWLCVALTGFTMSVQANPTTQIINYLLLDSEETDRDTTAPETAIAYPENGVTINGTNVYVVADATDDAQVDLVEFYVDGILKGASIGPTYIYIWNTTAVADGNHTLYSVAYDSEGNSQSSDIVSVNVANSLPDTTPPQVSISNPSDQAIVGNTNITIAATATDNNLVTQVEFFINGVSQLIDTQPPYLAPWDTNTVADGNYQLTATAIDNSGNSATSSVNTVEVNSVLAAEVSTTPHLDFDGDNDYVDLNNLDVAGNALTIEAWFNSRNFSNCGSTDCRIISKANGTSTANHYWMISTILSSSNPVLRFRLKTGGSTSTLIANSGALTENTWYHVAAVYDGSSMKLYLDGTEVGSLSKSGMLDTNSSIAAWIGGNPSGQSERPWDGLIDEVRIWNIARTQAEVSDNKDNQLTPGTFGLIGYYKFNEGAGQALSDSAGTNDTVLGSSAAIDNNDPDWSM